MSASVSAAVSATVVINSGQREIVEITTPGPQGPPGPTVELGALTNVDTTSAISGSVLYFDSASGEWKGNDINTVTTLTDGGNF